MELRGIEPLDLPAEIAIYVALLHFHVVTLAVVALGICAGVLRDVTVLAPRVAAAPTPAEGRTIANAVPRVASRISQLSR